jgi:WD40 repeat protein
LETGYGNPRDKFLDHSSLAAEIKIWDIDKREAIRTLLGHSKSIRSLAISPDGERLASASTDATVKIWKVATGRLETNLTMFNFPIVAVAFSPDGQTLAFGGGNPEQQLAELGVWDLAAGERRRNFKSPNNTVFALAFSPDGKTLASGGLDQVVRFWDVATGDEVRTIKGHKEPIWSLAFHPSGKSIATASWDQTVRVWDAEAQQCLELVPGGPVYSVYSGCFSPDGKYLIRGGRKLEAFEVGKKIPRVIISEDVIDDNSVAISPDGATLASAGEDAIVNLWEVGSWRRLASLHGHWEKVWCLAFSPDGRTVASGGDQTVRLWDVKNRLERAVFRPRIGGVRALVFTPGGRTLIAASDQEIAFLDVATGAKQTSLGKGSQFLALSPDGRYLARSNQPLYPESPLLELIDLSSMEVRWQINPHRAHVWHACFSPDGKTLATASWDGTAKLWNAASGQEMFAYRAPGVVWSVAFSPDGEWWAVGSGSPSYGDVTLFHGATLPTRPPAVTETAPTILAQPVSRTTTDARGSTATFGAFSAGSPPLAYQWRKGTNALLGQTNATLTFANVTAADAGDYSVVVTNALGTTTSSDSTLTVFPVREVPIAEINFQDKRPTAGYSAFTMSEARVALTASVKETADAEGGSTCGLVVKADRTEFHGWAKFGADVGVLANATSGVNTTNLDLYKLYATLRTSGITGLSSHGRIQWKFSTAGGLILAVETDATLATNYQAYSFILGEGRIDRGSLSEFAAKFDQINQVQCMVMADEWVAEYSPDVDNAIYIADIKFVRLTAVPPGMPGP